MSVPPVTESQGTVPRQREAGTVRASTRAVHTFREYWDLERGAWVPCPTRPTAEPHS